MTTQFTITEDDVRHLRDFGKLLTEVAKFDVTVDQVSKLHGYFLHFNRMMVKLEAHIMEVRKVHEASNDDE
jgi:hypothetical protein